MTAITADQMLRALAAGVFAMAPGRDAETVDWVDPKLRAILTFEDFHMAGFLKQRLRSPRFTVTVDCAFDSVVENCAARTPKRPDSWISPPIQAACSELHRRGFAHSVECWRDGCLVGGVFGIALGAFYSMESMFSREPDASKVAMAHNMARLRAGGFRLVDAQFISPHLVSVGAVTIDQPSYRRRLREALMAGGVNPAAPLQAPAPSGIDFYALERQAGAIHEGRRLPIAGAVVVRELTRPSGEDCGI